MPAGDTDALRFDLLGPLRVRRGAAEVPFASRCEARLLALLLVRGGGLVEVPEIVSFLWGDDAPATAVNMVQRYVGVVRRRLEPGLPARSHGRWLHRDHGGYRLRLEPDSLDLQEFRRRITDARRRADAGDHRGATDFFVTGLDLWRGRCAAGLGDQVRCHPAVVAIEQEYVVAVREAADAARRGGVAARLLPTLRAAAVLPFDETQQMVAPASSPKPVRARAGVIRPAELPPEVRAFAGRAEELRDAAAGFAGAAAFPHILAFDGMPGVGKTALAIRLAHRLTSDFPDGQLYADLRGFSRGAPPADPAHVLGCFLEALGWATGAVPAGVDARAALFRSAVAGRRVLVVLDNARDARQVTPLLPGSPGNAVIVTGRRRMTELATEHGADLQHLGVLTAGDARACVTARIGSRRASVEPAAVDEVIARCGRHPLALAVVAARAVADLGRPLSALAGDLRRHHGTLDAFGRDEAGGLGAAFASSQRLLSPEACRMLRMLASSSGSVVTVEAAAALEGISAADAKRRLVELVRTGLLDRHGWSGYRLHDLVRAFGAEPRPQHHRVVA